MKKMWMIAAVACAALMVSCGGEKKAEEKAKELQDQAVENAAQLQGQAVDAANAIAAGLQH